MFDRLGYTHRSRTNVEEKKKIAQIVASIIPMQATLFADASSTVMEALTLMADRDDITVLTNSIPVLSSLNQSGLNIMSTGGANNRVSCSLQGIIARTTIMNYHVDFVLTSCKGLKLDEGAYDSREGETEIKQLMIWAIFQLVMAGFLLNTMLSVLKRMLQVPVLPTQLLMVHRCRQIHGEIHRNVQFFIINL